MRSAVSQSLQQRIANSRPGLHPSPAQVLHNRLIALQKKSQTTSLLEQRKRSGGDCSGQVLKSLRIEYLGLGILQLATILRKRSFYIALQFASNRYVVLSLIHCHSVYKV